jgi:hypothetical protein
VKEASDIWRKSVTSDAGDSVWIEWFSTVVIGDECEMVSGCEDVDRNTSAIQEQRNKRVLVDGELLMDREFDNMRIRAESLNMYSPFWRQHP